MRKELTLSPLAHTWILDLDGTLVKHNGYLIDGQDSLLGGAKEFLDEIPKSDFIVVLTSRKEEYRAQTEAFLRENGVRYDAIVFGAPYGERIVVNDSKPSGLTMALAFEKRRDSDGFSQICIDETNRDNVSLKGKI